VLQSKLRVPVTRPDLVARPRLDVALDAGRSRVILVSAQAGFGKTTALAQWPEVLDGLGLLAERLPARVQLVLVARTDPAVPLARLRGRGQLVEVRTDDLRFTPEEVTTYLARQVGEGTRRLFLLRQPRPSSCASITRMSLGPRR
jgi:ATP/maltotriose-dependent transcriptional regulator MalT